MDREVGLSKRKHIRRQFKKYKKNKQRIYICKETNKMTPPQKKPNQQKTPKPKINQQTE